MNFQQIQNETHKYIQATYGRLPVAFTHGKGAWLYANNGEKYLDFLAGISVTNLGHAHPEITRVIAEQAGKLLHTSNLYYIESQAVLARKISEKSFTGKSFFANSGAEANEAAIKLARYYGNRIKPEKNKIISLKNSFHGRTLAALAMTGQTVYQQGFEPLPSNFHYADINEPGHLEKLVDQDTCAVMIEVIQGESGAHILPPAIVQSVRTLCDKYDALMIVDEIQTGMGRTGKWFGFQHYGIMPDVITLAKSLANGLPIGAMHAGQKVQDLFQPKSHGSTFGGGPFVTAVASKVFDILESGVLAEVEAKGQMLEEYLQELKESYPFVTEIRRKGLMIGIGVDGLAQKVFQSAMQEKLLLGSVGDHTIRMLPPLIIGEKEIKVAAAVLKKVFSRL